MRKRKKKREVRILKEMHRMRSGKDKGHGWAARRAAKRINKRKRHWTNPNFKWGRG